MLYLDNVTLCGVDTINFQKLVQAAEISQKHVCFSETILFSDKAIVEFGLGSHTPYIYSEKNSKMGSIISPERFNSIELTMFSFLYAFYQQIVSGKRTVNIVNPHEYEVLREDIPDEVLFRISDHHSILWIGTYPEQNDTPMDIWKILSD